MILQSLLEVSSTTKLEHLALNEMKGIKDKASFETLTEVLSQQKSLKTLSLYRNDLSGVELSQILATINSNKQALATLSDIKLGYNTWDTDEACHQLAILLANAHEIRTCDIR